MPKPRTQDEITTTVNDIYKAVGASPTPLSQISMRISSLGSKGWMDDDVERVCFGVFEKLLKSRGWKYLSELAKKQKRLSD